MDFLNELITSVFLKLRGAGPGAGSESRLPYADWMVHPSCVHSQRADFHCGKYAGAGI